MELEKEGMKNKEKRKRRKPKRTEENTSSWWSFEVLGLFWLWLHFTSVMPVSSGSTQIVGSSVQLIWQALSSHVSAWWSPKYASFGTECSQVILVPDALRSRYFRLFSVFSHPALVLPSCTENPKEKGRIPQWQSSMPWIPKSTLLGVGGHTWPL